MNRTLPALSLAALSIVAAALTAACGEEKADTTAFCGAVNHYVEARTALFNDWSIEGSGAKGTFYKGVSEHGAGFWERYSAARDTFVPLPKDGSSDDIYRINELVLGLKSADEQLLWASANEDSTETRKEYRAAAVQAGAYQRELEQLRTTYCPTPKK